MFRPFLALALMTAPALAQTADQEVRLADAVAAMEAQSLAFYASIDPRFVPILTPPEDAPDFSDNRRCFMARLEEGGGPDMLEDYITALEEISATEITTLLDLGANVPEVMMSDVVFAASSECGSLSYSTSKMVTPEFLALMDEPEVMNALMGQAR